MSRTEGRETYKIEIEIPKGCLVLGWAAAVTVLPIDETGDGVTVFRYDGGYVLAVGLSTLLHRHMLEMEVE